jgi:hypothetical protein
MIKGCLHQNNVIKRNIILTKNKHNKKACTGFPGTGLNHKQINVLRAVLS